MNAAGGTDAGEYGFALRRILETVPEDIAARLERFLRAAEESGGGIEGMRIEVFVDQDAEGPFDVWARFDGSGAFALDRRFDDERHLFGVEWGEDGWAPDVPPRPRGWSRHDLEHAIAHAVHAWIHPLLPPASSEGFWRFELPDGTWG